MLGLAYEGAVGDTDWPMSQVIFFARLQREGLWTREDQVAAEQLLQTLYDTEAEGDILVFEELNMLEAVVADGRATLRMTKRISPKKAIRKRQRRMRRKRVTTTVTLRSMFDPLYWTASSAGAAHHAASVGPPGLDMKSAMRAALAARWLDKTQGRTAAVTKEERHELQAAYKRAGELLATVPVHAQTTILMHQMAKHGIGHEDLAGQLGQPTLEELLSDARLHAGVERIKSKTTGM